MALAAALLYVVGYELPTTSFSKKPRLIHI
jgi:hypothetical protein